MGRCIAFRGPLLRWHDVDVKIFYRRDFYDISTDMRQFCNSDQVAGLWYVELLPDRPHDHMIYQFSFTDQASTVAFKMRWV